jgi:4'-phosphopantetheinyl transferase
VLSQEERERAARFHHEHNRSWFVFSHGLMRHILAACCGVEPAALRFVAGEQGKPSLMTENASRAKGISFSLSHSHGRALLAVTQGGEIGIDIEAINARTDVLGIASSYFCGPELEAIRAAPPERARDTFFRYWTAKESVLKAQGCGLGAPLDSFCIRFDSGAEYAAVQTFDTAHIREGWFVRSPPCDAGWCAAVAASGTEWSVEVIGEHAS